MLGDKKQGSFDQLSNENLIKWVENEINWEWIKRDKGVEIANLADVEDKSLFMMSVLNQVFTKKYEKLGSYWYRIRSNHLERVGPKVKRYDENALSYIVRKVIA